MTGPPDPAQPGPPFPNDPPDLELPARSSVANAQTIDVRATGNPPVGTTRSRGRIVVASGKKWGFPTGGFIGIYDRTGFLWGYLVTDEGEIHPACQDLRGRRARRSRRRPRASVS